MLKPMNHSPARMVKGVPCRAKLAASAISLAAVAAPRTEVIPLNYRTADEVLPIAQQVLGNEGRVSAYLRFRRA